MHMKDNFNISLNNGADERMEVFLKPEFSIFEEYKWLKSKKEGKEFEGTVSDYYFDYIEAMGVTKLNQLLNTDINELVKKSEGAFFQPGYGKIYGINDLLLAKLGRGLKGIEDYIPVSSKVRKELENIGIYKLVECFNYSADELLKVKGIGLKVLDNIKYALKTYHNRELEKSKKHIEKIQKIKAYNETHIFNQNFENIFSNYRFKHKSLLLNELEMYLNKSDPGLELLSGNIHFSNFESADKARKFNNSKYVRLFKRSLVDYVSCDLGLQGVSCGADKYLSKFNTELIEIINLILEPLKKHGCFGKFNPYSVFIFVFSYDTVFEVNMLKLRFLYFRNLEQFFKFENILLGRPYNSPFNVKPINI